MAREGRMTSGGLQLLEPTDERWLALAASDEQACIFHHPAWMKVLHDCYGYRPFILGTPGFDGTLGAGLPVAEIKLPWSRGRWVSLPFADYCMPLAHEATCLEGLCHGLTEACKACHVSGIEIRWRVPVDDAMSSCTDYVLHTLRLEPDANAVMGRLHRNHRQNIRTAEKRGVRVQQGAELEQVRDFYRLQLETRRRKGLPAQPWRYFVHLTQDLLQRGLGFVLLGFKDEACIAGALFLHWGHTLTAKYAASREETLALRPNDLLFWTAIQWGCENGYTSFDMGRTDIDNTGLREFKNRWGAEETPLTYCKGPRVQANIRSARFFPLFQRFIQKSPAWVCRTAGEVLYRYAA